MHSSFDALHHESRPLTLMDEPAPPTSSVGVTLATLVLIVLPLVAVALL